MNPPAELVGLSRRLGEPSLDLAILAEGNTSCSDGENFWVKASGFSLNGIAEDGFVLCDPRPLLTAFDHELSDDDVRLVLEQACPSSSNPLSSGGEGLGVRGQAPRLRPSVEAFMHAWLLTLPGVEFVGHVHPTAVLSLVCSPDAQGLCRMRFFPDEVVCCGAATAWVPYVDPGLPLAVKIRDSVTHFVKEHGETPKVIWMQNHGLIALGQSSQEVESAILMNVKASRMILMAGGLSAVDKDKVVPLSPETVERIRTRPDEHYRQQLLWKIEANH